MRRLAALLLAMALVIAGCTDPRTSSSDPSAPPTAASLGKSAWPVLGLSRPVVGVDLYALDNYSKDQVRAYGQTTLAYIKNVLKADAVGIVWNFYAASPYADSVKATDATLSASNVAILTEIAKQQHLMVEYRPLIMIPSASNHWEGGIKPFPPSRWFSSYYRLELPYLKVAQRLHVSEFVVATEMAGLNNSTLWPSFFTRISHVYHGLISYTAWDGNYFGAKPGESPRQSASKLLPVKYIGMDMYWPMNIRPDASPAEVTAAWVALFGKMPRSVLRRTAIDEMGIKAQVGGYSSPQAGDQPGAADEQVQANWFTAACQTVRHYHLRGVFFFKVDLTDNTEHPATSLSTFEGREGATAISHCARILH
jgi:hypothetical protein